MATKETKKEKKEVLTDKSDKKRMNEDLFAQSQLKPKKMTLTGYAAVWQDDATGTYGTERVFLSHARCLTFAANLIVRKAKELEVSIIDLDAPPSTWKGEKIYPVLSKAQVRDILGGGDEFALATKFDELACPIEQFKISIMEVEIE